ncbi:MAG: hypothetical protein IJZ56_01730 [Oscillospiraceae bacterium]|nr:hypothetical protein [Oscillospiraceae bacterium]
MKRKQKLLSWVVLGAGLLGTALCLLSAGIDTDDRGLLPAGHPTHIFIYLLTAVVIGFLLYVLRDVQGSLPYNKAFPVDILALAGHGAGVVGIVSASVSILLEPATVLGILAGVSGFLAAGCLGLIGFFRYKKLRPNYIFHAVITVHLVLLLVFRYQAWNTQPQLQLYFTQLMASLFLMLTLYHRAALDAGTGNRRDFAFFNLGAVFFCCLALVSEQWLFYLGMGAWCFTNQCCLKRVKALQPMVLPEEVLYCIHTLCDAGYSAYAVGGCVRDHLLGLTPSDYDLCTSATPDEICELFERHQLVRNGEKHGTIGVVVAGQLYEITTFRTEGTYSDTRHPDQVEFVTDIREDLARRDFTVNAMAFHPEIGYVDPFGGQKDLANKILRAVGDPQIRFREDALRILRGVRFSVRFDLTPEKKTLEAMNQSAPLMENLAKERVSAELCKLLPLISTDRLLQYKTIFTQVIPALAEGDGIYENAAKVVGLLKQDLPLRMAGLLHSLGEDTANEVLLALKASNALRSRTTLLVGLQSPALPPDKKQLQRILGEHGAEAVEQLLYLQTAIAKAAGKATDELEVVQLLLGTIRQDGCCLTVKDLAITGSDLLALGVKPGPQIGRCMQSLLSLVQDDILGNAKEELMDAAKNFFEIKEDV